MPGHFESIETMRVESSSKFSAARRAVIANLYVAQFASNRTYPIKLKRV